jgi:hypothetical protein
VDVVVEVVEVVELVVVVVDEDAEGASASVDGAARAREPLTNPQASVAAAFRPSLERRRRA